MTKTKNDLAKKYAGVFTLVGKSEKIIEVSI